MPEIELLRDDDHADAWLLLVDGVPQSYVDLDDPAHLDFTYAQVIAAVIDYPFPMGQRLTTIHVGGAGLTLPRWLPRPGRLASARPGTGRGLTAVVRERLPLQGQRHPRASGAPHGLATRADASADLVVLDAYDGGRVPGS